MKTTLFRFGRSFVLQLSLTLALVLSFPTVAVPSSNDLKEGDLIFQESQGPLTPAIREATGSTWTHVGLIVKQNNKWYVLESSNKVEISRLENFVQRHKKGGVLVKRLKREVHVFTPEEIQKLKENFLARIGQPYDLFFEWSDEAYYCSELTYKLFAETIGLELGQVQKFKDLRLDGAEVQKMIAEKKRQGHNVDIEEAIITPIAQFNSPMLELVRVYRE